MGGASSKSTFSSIVQQILISDIESNNHSFWDDMWKTVLTASDVFDLISADDVRKIIEDHPENMKIIVTQAVAQLYQVVETPYPIYFDQALNCSRILARLLPFLMETNSPTMKELLWSRRTNVKPDSTNNLETADESDSSEPLAVILVNTIFHLMFLPEFTVEDPNTEFTESDIHTPEFKSALMWAPGVGCSEKTVVNSTQFDENRIDVLRLMIAAFCDSLYQSADCYDSCASMWLEVATSADAPYAEIVFYSLMNTVLGYDPIGWGVPYGNMMSTDTAKIVMEHSVQALVILLDYGHPMRTLDSAANGTALPSVNATDTEAQGFNVFRRLLGSVEAPDQLNFMYRGFVRLLNNVHQAESTYLPYSITRIGIEQELLILFWKCLEEVPTFMPYILKHCDITEIFVPICYFLLEGRKDPSKVGLLYLCTFTLLKLSGERSFGVALNKPYNLTLPVDVPLFSGNHADLLVIALHKLIVSGLEKLSALYSCFLTIICNVSPYCKTLGTVASVKLVNLLQLFVSPRFLYAAEGNHVYVGMLLETLNNIVQYQYEGNGHLIYAIVRRKEIFEGIANLRVPKSKNSEELNSGRKAPVLRVGDKGGTEGTSATQDESVPIFPEATPTDLISTSHVERREEQGGKVVDYRSRGAGAESVSPSLASTSATQRFTPSEAWLQMVKSELPLNTVMRLLKHLVPQVEELASGGVGLDEKQVIDFLHSTTMVGLLPVPHPIVIRKYMPNRFTCLWFTAFQWGVIFMHNQSLPLFDGKCIKLFIVQTVS